MRTALRVMLLLLFAGCRAAFAQDSGGAGGALDREITIVGRDQAAIPIPHPWKQEQVSVPSLDVESPDPHNVPAIPPPTAEWSAPPAELLIVDPPPDTRS
jgi:hypothetical protein